MKKLLLASLWIMASEFFRNELLLKQLWVEHYAFLGLEFSTKAQNGMLWLVWSFLLAFCLQQINKRTQVVPAAGITWLLAFPMMWIVLYNLQVLPLKLLLLAIPLSAIEIIVASYLVQADK